MTDAVDGSAFGTVARGLFQPGRGLYLAPVRHHSPACAWALRALIEEIRPRRILIEAPVDFAPLIELLLDADTRPPVAIAALVEEGGEDGRRLAGYYPFCAHSPELVALHAGRAIGASLDFVDLPSASRTMRLAADEGTPVALTDETRFDRGDWVRALCERYGCRDGFELWDHLFESRLGTADWRGLFADVGAYCAGLREATDAASVRADRDDEREAHMARAVRAALDGAGPVVVVAGGFHVPALIGLTADEARSSSSVSALAPKREPRSESEAAVQPSPERTSKPARAYLIRYGFAALDALGGYAAGLPQPGWYDELWRRANAAGGPPDWRETAIALAAGFVARSREEGHPISVPAQVEMLRAAESLALLRGRPGILRHDLFDGVRVALIKGEAGPGEPWTARLTRYLRGDALGDVPRSAGSPPLVEDARAEARRHRIDVTDGARRRRHLDVRRNPAHLAASRFLHAMTLLGTGFAERESGPDHVHGIGTELLFEDWSYAWSPLVEGRLIELSAGADRVDGACLAWLLRTRSAMSDAGRAHDVARLVELLALALQAGLGDRLAPFVRELANDVRTHADFAEIARALERLHYLARSTGPIGAPESLDLYGVEDAAYRRLVYLCDDLAGTREEDIASRLDALRLVAHLLEADRGREDRRRLDAKPFDAAIDRVADASPPAEILGAVLAICVRSGLRAPSDLTRALDGHFRGSATDATERTGVLRGLLHTAPALLWQGDGVLEAVDAFVATLDADDFLTLLPHLRLAFAALNPREVDRVAGLLASVHGGGASAFTATSHAFDENDLAAALQLETTVRRSLEADGLGAWFGLGGER